MKNTQTVSRCFSLVMLASLALLPGCIGKKKDKKEVKKMCQMTGDTIPVAGRKGSSKFFDSRVEALVLADDERDLEDRDVYAYSVKDKRKSKGKDQDWQAHKSKNFETILFDFDDYQIRADQEPVVAYNVEKAREEVGQGKKLKVEGHADKQCLSEVYNIAVSQKRAHTVAKTLAKSGVDSSIISAVGFGDKYPAVDKPGKVQENRRAEIVAV